MAQGLLDEDRKKKPMAARTYEGTPLLSPTVTRQKRKETPDIDVRTAEMPLGGNHRPEDALSYQALQRLEKEAAAASPYGKMGWQTRRALMGQYGALAKQQMADRTRERVAEAGHEMDLTKMQLGQTHRKAQQADQQSFLGGESALGRAHQATMLGARFGGAKEAAAMSQKYRLEQLKEAAGYDKKSDYRRAILGSQYESPDVAAEALRQAEEEGMYTTEGRAPKKGKTEGEWKAVQGKSEYDKRGKKRQLEEGYLYHTGTGKRQALGEMQTPEGAISTKAFKEIMGKYSPAQQREIIKSLMGIQE